MANETVSSSINHYIYEEHIPTFAAQYRYGGDLSGIIPWVEQVPKGGGTDFRFPRAQEVTVPAGTKTEGTGAFTNVEFQSTAAVATSGVFGFTYDISRESQYDSRPQIPQTALEAGLKAMQRRLNTDMFAPATALTGPNLVGSDSVDLDVDLLLEGLAAFEAVNPESKNIAVVVSNGQPWADLLASMSSSAASLMPDGFRNAQSAAAGYKGTILNGSVALFTSPHIATSTGASVGVITEMGRGRSGLGVAVWQRTQIEREPVGGRYADLWHFSARTGCVLTGEPIVALRSRATA